MGIKTIYVCEKCGHEAISGEDKAATQYWYIGINIKQVHVGIGNVRGQQLWCRKCCDELQLIIDPQGTSKEKAPAIIPLEEKLAMLLEDLGFKRE